MLSHFLDSEDGTFTLWDEDTMSLLSHFDRLQTMRDQMEERLDLDEAGISGSGRMDYRRRRDLRDRIAEISEEIFALEQRSRCCLQY